MRWPGHHRASTAPRPPPLAESALALPFLPASVPPVSKSERIAHLRVENSEGLEPRYAGWFACFNRGDYYEAHDILEDLWLEERGRPLAKFHQGLIQLAGAFVHLQKNRLRPADALFSLAEASLGRYAPHCERLDLRTVLS